MSKSPMPPKSESGISSSTFRTSVSNLKSPLSTALPPVIAPPEPSVNIDPAKLLAAWNNNYQTMLGVIDLVNKAMKLAKRVVIPLCLATLVGLAGKEYVDHKRAEALQAQMTYLSAKGGAIVKKLDTFTGSIDKRLDANEKRLALVVEAMVKTNEAEIVEAESNQAMPARHTRVLKRKAAAKRAEALASSLKAQEAVVSEPTKKARVRNKLTQLRASSKKRGLEVSF